MILNDEATTIAKVGAGLGYGRGAGVVVGCDVCATGLDVGLYVCSDVGAGGGAVGLGVALDINSGIGVGGAATGLDVGAGSVRSDTPTPYPAALLSMLESSVIGSVEEEVTKVTVSPPHCERTRGDYDVPFEVGHREVSLSL